MDGIRRTYNLQGVRLDVLSAGARLAQTADAVLCSFRGEPPSPGEYGCALRYGPVPGREDPLDGAEARWTGPLEYGAVASHFAAGDLRRFDVHGLSRLEMDLSARRAEITAAPGAEWCLPSWSLVPMLAEFLRMEGHFLLHAATLFAGSDGDRRAIIVAGPSGRGKTTTALSLMRSGMAIAADDITFVQTHDERSAPVAWGMLPNCKVLAPTLKLLPWLEQFSPRRSRFAEEYHLDPGALVAGNLPPAPVAGVLLLDPPNERAHRIEPIDKPDALGLLIRENLRAADGNAQGPAGQTFRALTSLVGRCKTWRLSVSPRLETLGDAVRQALEL